MQAIVTKFIPRTNTKPDRIKAICAAGSATICSDTLEVRGQAAHRAAAEALMAKLHWGEKLLGGCMPDGNYCFVMDCDYSRE